MMRTSVFPWTLAAAWLLTVLPVLAQDDVSPANVERAAAAAGPGETQRNPPDAGTETFTVILGSSALDKAIDQLPAGLLELAPLETLRQQVYASTTQDRRPLLWDAARAISGRITTETPPNQLEALVNVAAQLAAQLYLVSQPQADQEWGSNALEVLSRLEERLAKEFSTRLELAATVGLERIKIQVIPKLGGSVDDYWVKAPTGLNAFLERYPSTTAAAQAAWLMGDACETAQNTPPGLPTPAVGQFPEPTFLWYHAAIKQAPDSLWGKLARGCLNRLDLVGQTLEVSGTSLVGKPLSLESFRGKPTVVVFFRPGKSSWGTAENGGDFAAAVRARGFEVLGVLCHSPTAAPDEIDRIAKPRVPPEEEPADRMPVIEDAVDVDSSYSVRFGITAPRLFVRVDESGKVVRTALTEINDLDEFLGLAAKPLAADATSPADATLTLQSSTARSMEVPDSPAPAKVAQEPSLTAFRLKHGLAAEYVKLAQVMFPLTRMSADDRSNSIVIYGTQSELEKVEALMLALDQAATVSSSKPPSQPPETAKAKLAGPNRPATTSRPTTEPRTSQREVLVFTATWASPCQRVLPVLRSIAKQGAPMQFIDIDRQPELARRHQVTSIPAVIVIEDGREVDRVVGDATRQKFETLILGKTVSPPDTPRTPGRSSVALSDDPFAASQVSSVPLPLPSRSQPRGLLVLESRAAELASNVRELTKTHGSEHPELIAARQQLEQTLAEALELKFRAEKQQVAALEQRLARLKLQLDQRKAVQSQIVERRMRELLENPVTDWDALPDAPGKFPVLLGAEVAPGTRQLASPDEVQVDFYARDQITVDLYATDGIYQNQKLLGAVVAPLNKIPQVVANVRMVPGDSGKFVFAIVRDPSQRLHRETQQTGKESPTRQAVIAALKAGGIIDVRWEGAIDVVPSNDARPAGREVAAPVSTMPPARKPAESLESSARLPLDLAEAEADIRETEARLAIQVKLHAKGVVAIDEVTGAMQRRDRAVRKRQILLDEYAATVKDLELQLSAASLENDLAVSDHRRLLQLVEQKAVPLKEAQDAALRAVRSAHMLERLKNLLEFLKNTGEGSAVKETSPSKPPGETSELLRGPSQPPQAVPASAP